MPCRATAPTSGEPIDRPLLVVEQNDLAKRSSTGVSYCFEPLDLARPSQILREHDVMARSQMRIGHPEGERSCERSCLREAFPPAADEAAHLVDVDVEYFRMLIHIPLGDRGLPDTWRSVEMDEPRRSQRLWRHYSYVPDMDGA